jgi:TonB family protein
VQGSVVLRAVISKTGTIEDLKVVSGPKELTESAIDAVKRWKYLPYLLNSQPVEVDTTITVNYMLEGSAEIKTPENVDASGEQPKKAGGAISAPVLLYAPEPEFSAQAREDKVSGNVKLSLWVDEKGRPSHVHVVKGVGHGLDEKAIEAVQAYKFKPAMEHGKPVLVSLNVEVNFQFF